MIKLYPSFSGLLRAIIRDGYEFKDDQESFYLFQNTENSAESVMEIVDWFNELDRSDIMAQLKRAQWSGRVYWRGSESSADEKSRRAEYLSQILGIPAKDMIDSLSNLKDMKEFFSKYPNVQLVGTGSF